MFFFNPASRGTGRGGIAHGLAALVILTALAATAVSCDDGGGGSAYPSATARVDYNGTNRAVFFDFSTGKATEVPHDFFDIAFDGGGKVIANSGSYGSGVTVLKTSSTAITDDFTSTAGADGVNIKEYTFSTNAPLYDYQTAANPLANLGMAASNVYLVKVQYGTTAEYFKVVLGMTMMGSQSFNLTAVPGLGSGEAGKVELKAPISGLTRTGGYGWLYFKLVGTGGPRVLNNGTTWLGTGADAAAVPRAEEWDLLFTRTNELQTEDGTTVSTEMPVAGRSSVLLNTYRGVEAAKAAGKVMEQVFNTTGLSFSGEVDAIGYSWYNMTGMPPTFSVPANTFVVKTAQRWDEATAAWVDGPYAKFQPGTFYGPNSESFYMVFRYLDSGSSAGTFSQ
jgi:hypothetical protein